MYLYAQPYALMVDNVKYVVFNATFERYRFSIHLKESNVMSLLRSLSFYTDI